MSLLSCEENDIYCYSYEHFVWYLLFDRSNVCKFVEILSTVNNGILEKLIKAHLEIEFCVNSAGRVRFRWSATHSVDTRHV